MNNKDKNNLFQIANFIEELSWLMESNKNLSLKEISRTIRELSDSNSKKSNITSKYSLKNANNQFLVGVLPTLLQDKELFKGNSEMLDFAESVLNLSPSKAAKRSRIEYIGWIVCEVASLSNSKLEKLVQTLSGIVGDEIKIKKMKEAKKQPNFSWNEAIQKLNN